MAWSPHIYYKEAKEKAVFDNVIAVATSQIQRFGEYTSDSKPAAILSLKHLSIRSGVPYYYLRKLVERNYVTPYPYSSYIIKKRSGGYRNIHVPSTYLYRVQKWINTFVLNKVQVHEASCAFFPGSSNFECARRHCGARWLIKLDLEDFFDSISEIQVFHGFRKMGYQPLVAFELARILTKRNFDGLCNDNAYWTIHKQNQVIQTYSYEILGHLPQGAPTSPMMSNIVMKDIDKDINNIALENGLIYTRYSDDIVLSTSSKRITRKELLGIVESVNRILAKNKFRIQKRKTKIIPPGTNKIVLGLNVSGQVPKLPQKFKDKLKSHLHFIKKYGTINHKENRKFRTILGMKAHIKGLIDYANMIEPEFSQKMLMEFRSLDW